MSIPITLSNLNSVAPAGIIGVSSCSYSPIGKTPVSCSARQVISLVNIRSSYSKHYHKNTFVQSGRITILRRSKQFSRCSRSYNNRTSLEEGADSTCNNPTSLEVGDNNNNNNDNDNANTRTSSYDTMGGSSSSLISLSSSSRSCSCNCQNTSPFIQINFFFPHWFPLSSSPIAMLAHVYSNLHPLMDQLMMYVRGGSLILFQSAVLDKRQVLRRKLNKIAGKADTSTLRGLNYTLKGAVKAILQCNDSYIKFTKLHKKYDSMKSLSKSFEEFLSQELERHGEDEDTLVNADSNVKYGNKASMVKYRNKSRRTRNEYTVVTLLVLATGKHSIPYITENGTRIYYSFEVLQTLQCIPKNEIQSVKVLWSPRKEGEVLLEDEMLIDFPKLIRTVLT